MAKRSTASEGNGSASTGLRPAFPSFHRYVAAQAVLAPLCEVKEATFPPRLETVQALRNLWPQRLEALRIAGWDSVQKPMDLGYAAHCPSYAFALDDTGYKPCNKYRVCPFCHGLRTALLYENVLRALRRQPGKLNLYIIREKRYCPADEVIAALDALRAYDKTRLMGGGNVVGVVSRTAAAPAKFNAGRVSLRHAALVAVPAGVQPPDEAVVRGNAVPADDLGLAVAVASLARYPAGLLYEDADAVAALFKTLARRRLSASYGVFYSARSAVDARQIRDQRPAPAVRPEPPSDRLAEEETIVANIPVDCYPHERFAVRSLLARLGKRADADAFDRASSLPMPLTWIGPQRLTVREFHKPPKWLRLLFKPFRGQGDHGLATLAPGAGFFVFSTLTLSRAALLDDGCAAEKRFQRRPYVYESMGQFGSRVRLSHPALVGAGLPVAQT